jgi:galactokinase
MPAAIDKGIQFAIAPSKTPQSTIYSLKYNEYYSIDHSNLSPVGSPQWINYLLGIMYQFELRGFSVRPFNCVFAGDLPTGAGLSSSAAMECGFALALNELNHCKLSKLEMIHIAQWAEHHYVGVKCGIMDQFTSMMGMKNRAIVLDCRDLSYNYFPLELGEYTLLLCDTKVKHSLASSEYNTRRRECEQGVAILKAIYPSIESLRDVTIEMLQEHRDHIGENIFNRCYYVVQENERVLKGSEDLKNRHLAAFGEKMFRTHEGLSKLFEVSCSELDFLVEFARNFEGVIGSRMMGGGFGGCTLNLVRKDRVGDFVHQVTPAYKEKFNLKPPCLVVNASDGCSVIENPFI